MLLQGPEAPIDADSFMVLNAQQKGKSSLGELQS